MNIRFGRKVSKLSDITLVGNEGFDWACVSQSAVTALNDRQFEQFREAVISGETAPDICVLDFPEDVIFTGKGFNVYIWLEYFKKVILRLSRIGCRTLVWHDGEARMLPEEGDILGAKEQVMQFLFLIAEFAGQHDMHILVEPLGEEKTNYLNTLGETAAFIETIGSSNLGMAVTSGELGPGATGLESLEFFKDDIHLVTVDALPADERGRRLTDDFLTAFARAGYNEAVLLPEDSPADFLRRCRELLTP